jgi:hypothetical protein
MQSALEMKWSWIEGSHTMREELLNGLTDADLAFNPGGQNMTLGGLCREMGEVEYSYIQSLKTFKQDWAYHNTEAGLDSSIAQLLAWYRQLDAELKETVSRLSDDDVKKSIDRGSGFMMPVDIQVDVYLQALLIFFGKAVIYLKAMNKPLPPTVKDYIW